jgi:hypothetical protein
MVMVINYEILMLCNNWGLLSDGILGSAADFLLVITTIAHWVCVFYRWTIWSFWLARILKRTRSF